MIIVTGGAGFIGSNLVKELNRRGRVDILIVDDLRDGANYKNLKGLQFIDYQHKDDFLQSVESDDFDGTDIDAVFHEGACSDTMEYDVNFMMKVNYEYSKALLHFCMEHRIPFIYASSASTYGGGKNGFREGDECEDALNPYAFSKLAFDRYVRQVLPEARSQIVGLKYFNVFGPQEHHKGKMASIFYQLYNQIKETGKARLFEGSGGYDNGEQRRDFVYVKDVVTVNLWFWENRGESGIYNCGTGHAHTYNEAAKAVIAALGRGEIEYRPFPEVLKDKYQNYTQADSSHLLAAGYDQGFTDFKTAVKEYVDFLEAGGYFTYGD
ncbi:MAG: ADP-glyceromanno-heptose 6-epimerase [Selenomonadaceae bacterium]|nr:ADP-glyceromanno-heptose 6-epimerase [Selenomonadaceae bacterium]